MEEFRIEEKIGANLIRTDDEFCLEYGREKEAGFSGFPLLVFDGKLYSLVSGRDEVQRCRTEKKPLRYALVVDLMGDRLDLLRSLIRIKHETRGFNVIETAIAVKRLYCLSKNMDPDMLYRLGIPGNERFIEGYVCLADAPDTLKKLVLNGKLDKLTAFEIFSFERRNWVKVSRFTAGLKLGTKKRNSLLSMIYDIVQRDGLGVERLVESKKIKDILKMQIDPPHKGQKVYEAIERIRYPYITQYKEKFYETLRKVGMGRDFHLTVPQDFEQWCFSISFSFTSVDDFKRKVELLDTIGSKSTFQELMDLRY